MRRTLLIALFIYQPLVALCQRDIPELANRRVHDDAGILSPQIVAYLEQSLRTFEDSTSNQLAILTVPSLEGESIDQFGIRVAEAWKLGTADRDNGVILLIAVEDRKMRIEVGQGLEGPLPDAICNRIIRNEMAPAFRRQDYDDGVVAAIDGIRKAIKGEYTGSGPRAGKRRLPMGFVILIIILILVMRSRHGGRGSGWSSGRGWYGGGFGGSGGGGGFSGFSGGGGSFGGGGSSGSW